MSPFRLLYWEAAFALAYETWVGQTYLSGLAGELRVSVALVTLVTALPWLGASSQLIVALFFQKKISRNLKTSVLRLSGLGRALWIIPLVTAFFLDIQTWFTLTAITAFCTTLLLASSSLAWLTWMQKFIPSRVRGRFFATRQRFTMGAILFANLLAIWLTGLSSDGKPVGYWALGLLAVTFGLTSTFILTLIPAPKKIQEKLATIKKQTDWVSVAKTFLFVGCFHFSLQVASPYFPYYFTSVRGFSMSDVSFWIGMSNVGSILFAPFWGRWLDRVGDLKKMVTFCTLGISTSSLFYWGLHHYDPSITSWVAPIEHFVNGAIWSGQLICIWKLLYQHAPEENSVLYFSVFLAIQGIFSALGVFVGGLIAPNYQTLWLVAAALRVTVALVFVPQLLSLRTTPAQHLR